MHSRWWWVAAAVSLILAVAAFLYWLFLLDSASTAADLPDLLSLGLAILSLLVAVLTLMHAMGVPLFRGGKVLPVAIVVVMLGTSGILATGFLPSEEGCPLRDGESAGRVDKRLVFGALFPQGEGDLQSEGRQLYAATSLAVNDVQAAGRTLGLARPALDVDVPALDPLNFVDEGNPGSGAVCIALDKLMTLPSASESPVDAIMGPVASSSVLSAAKRVNVAGGILISPASTAPELSELQDGRSTFRTVPSDVLQGRVLGDVIVGEGASNEKVAIVARDDSYGVGLQNEIFEEVSGFGTREVFNLKYDPQADPSTKFSTVLDSLSERRPEAIVLVGYDELSGLIQEMYGRGIGPGTQRIYGTDGFLRGSFPQRVAGPASVEGIRGTIPRPDEGLVQRLRATAGGNDFAYSAEAYDAVVITALAAAAAGSDDPQILRSTLNDITRAGAKCRSYVDCLRILAANPDTDIDYDGASGPLDFTGNGEPCQGRYAVVRFTAQGTLEKYGEATGQYLCTTIAAVPPKKVY